MSETGMKNGQGAPLPVKIGGIVGGILVSPAIAMLVFLCWETVRHGTGIWGGSHPAAGSSKSQMFLFYTIVILGPAIVVGGLVLLVTGLGWLLVLGRGRNRVEPPAGTGVKNGQGMPLSVKIGGIVGGILVAPATAIPVFICWETVRHGTGTWSNWGGSGPVGGLIAVLGPSIVLGGLVLLVTGLGWLLARGRGRNRVELPAG